MAFSVNLLTTVAQCDGLLTSKQRERKNLVNRLNNLNYQLENWDDVTSVEAELTSTQAYIAGLAPLIQTQPDGDEKRRNQNTLNRYQTRANNLIGKVENYGALAKLEKELDRDGVASDIEVLDAFVAAVTARRAEL